MHSEAGEGEAVMLTSDSRRLERANLQGGHGSKEVVS
jgi:hypothetical protein